MDKEDARSELEVKDLLTVLLKQLGIYPKDGKVKSDFQDLHMSGCFLMSIDSQGICKAIDETDAFAKYVVCKSFKQLANGICNVKKFRIPQRKSIFAFWKDVSNPYYGCKSIEEMMIQYDLTNNV